MRPGACQRFVKVSIRPVSSFRYVVIAFLLSVFLVQGAPSTRFKIQSIHFFYVRDLSRRVNGE